MTKRDFFRTLIKVFGLYSLITTIFYFIPSNISYLTTTFEVTTPLWLLIPTILVALVFIFLIKKADTIINLLKIDQGFDDEFIQFGDFNDEEIIRLALILIGAFLIIDYTPDFLQYTYLAFKQQTQTSGLIGQLDSLNFDQGVNYFYWGNYTINIILGYFLLTNYSRIAKWIKKEKNVG